MPKNKNKQFKNPKKWQYIDLFKSLIGKINLF